LPQPGGHVAVALGDQRLVQLRRVLGELGEGGLEDVALLELLDRLFVDLVRAHHAQGQPAHQVEAFVPRHAGVAAPQRRREVAVDQLQREIVGFGGDCGGAHFGARFDAKLLGDAPLVGAQGQVGHDQPRLAFAQHAIQVEVGPLALRRERIVAGLAQFHRNGVEPARGGQFAHGVSAGPRDVGRADQRVIDAVTPQPPDRLLFEQRAGCFRGGRIAGICRASCGIGAPAGERDTYPAMTSQPDFLSRTAMYVGEQRRSYSVDAQPS
jgi:hypothetical protein